MSVTRISKAAAEELHKLTAQHRTLKPETLVRWARQHPKSHLHKFFQWDDGKAAQLYRLDQARHLIRVIVTVLPQTTQKVRTFVSLTKDRGSAGVGYRRTADVMRNNQLRPQLIAQFLMEFKRFELRYRNLTELAEVFDAVDRVREKHAEMEAA